MTSETHDDALFSEWRRIQALNAALKAELIMECEHEWVALVYVQLVASGNVLQWRPKYVFSDTEEVYCFLCMAKPDVEAVLRVEAQKLVKPLE